MEVLSKMIKIQHRRGTKARLPSLSIAELGFTTDTNEVFIGGNNGNVQLATLDEHGNVEQLPELAFVKLSDKATSNDVKTGTDNTKWVTPSGLMSGLSLNAPKVVLLTSGSLKVSSHQININPTLPSNIFDYKTLILKFTITPRTFSLSGSYACDCHIRTQQYNDGDDVICSYELFTGTPLNIPKVFQRECQLVSLSSSGRIDYILFGKNANLNTSLSVGADNVMQLYAGYNPSGSSATFDVSYYIYGKESAK